MTSKFVVGVLLDDVCCVWSTSDQLLDYPLATGKTIPNVLKYSNTSPVSVLIKQSKNLIYQTETKRNNIK